MLKPAVEPHGAAGEPVQRVRVDPFVDDRGLRKPLAGGDSPGQELGIGGVFIHREVVGVGAGAA